MPRRFMQPWRQFGAPLQDLTPEDFIEPGKFYRMGHPPLMIDILPEISGVDFNQAWEKRVEVEIDAGLKVSFIDADSLIAAKLASGRPEDLADVAAATPDGTQFGGGVRCKRRDALRFPALRPIMPQWITTFFQRRYFLNGSNHILKFKKIDKRLIDSLVHSQLYFPPS